MRKKLNTAIDILFESLYFLTITYVLSSMAISFNFDLFGLLCRVANIFAITQYYTSMKKHTNSHFWTAPVLLPCLACGICQRRIYSLRPHLLRRFP